MEYLLDFVIDSIGISAQQGLLSVWWYACGTHLYIFRYVLFLRVVLIHLYIICADAQFGPDGDFYFNFIFYPTLALKMFALDDRTVKQ